MGDTLESSVAAGVAGAAGSAAPAVLVPRQDLAARVLEDLRRRGFDQAQVSVGDSRRCELNLAHNEASLMRSNRVRKLSATAIAGGRKASSEATDLSDAALADFVEGLWTSAASAPRDEANAVSAGQRAHFVRGPQQAEPEALARALRTLLDWRAANAATMMFEEGLAAHQHSATHTVTSAGSEIASVRGWCELSVFGLAREGENASSFNYAGGVAESLVGVPQLFGVDRMISELVRQVHTQPLGERFVGEVVLAPGAVADLLGWLMGQLGDGPLIDGSSLYRERVGTAVASPLITLKSRYDAPGCVPLSADAFVTPDATLIDAGTLTQLGVSLYGSRKTGLPHKPLAMSGWELLPGTTPLQELITAVPRGALVARLSMGDPAPNGDFSGVIKNSFVIRGGELGPALSETMINGNVATMLGAVLAVSAERLDTGSECLPWLRIGGLHFS